MNCTNYKRFYCTSFDLAIANKRMKDALNNAMSITI